MDLQLQNKQYVVCGATSGFGKAITESLINENSNVIGIARQEELLSKMKKQNPSKFEYICGDVTDDATHTQLINYINDKKISGMIVNAGGPPAKFFLETQMADWDNAYNLLLRWKVKLTHSVIPMMEKNNFGRIIYIESVSVKQPVENLVLSTSLRLAVVGFVKTLSQEIASKGITLNILAPGYHDTAAMERLFTKKSQLQNITKEAAREEFEKEIKTGNMGNPKDFASLALWLLSPYSQYVTGQTISVDGGLVKGIMG